MIRNFKFICCLVVFMPSVTLCSCSHKTQNAGNTADSVGRSVHTDSLYSAAAFRRTVKSATFLPSDSVHDFGLIDGRKKVSHTFVFTNKGKKPVVIDTVRSHCGCTTSSYTRKPVMPGGKGTVVVTYDPTDHYGGFRKTATLLLNGGEEYQEVRVVGRVRDRF